MGIPQEVVYHLAQENSVFYSDTTRDPVAGSWGVLLSYADGNGCNPHVPCSWQPESTRVCGCSSLSGGHLSPTCARAAAGPRRVPSGRVLPHYGFLSPIPPWLGNSLSLTMDLTGWRLETNSVTFGLHGTEPSLSLMSPSSGL